MSIRRPLLCIATLSLAPVGAASAQFSPCWGDITLDHNTGVNDLLVVISSWGPCVGAPPAPNGPPDGGFGSGEGGIAGTGMGGGGGENPPPVAFCPADIAPIGNPDGVVDVDDLLVVISTWGQCMTPPTSPGLGYVVWCEDWSTGNYDRWTSEYNNDTNPCTVAGFQNTNFVSAASAMRSQITCAGGVNGVHRGYGGLRFLGESVLPTFAMPSNGGIYSTNGLVVQWRGFLQVPYLFNSQDHDLWMSMMTITDDCSNAWHDVIGLNIDDETMRLRPGHVAGIQYTLGAPAFPRNQWVRVTVYVNYNTGEMHVWQNGIKIVRAWFEPETTQTCQYHFGLYASGANWNITYYEDDLRIIKLMQPLSGDLIAEPVFPGLTSPCAAVSP